MDMLSVFALISHGEHLQADGLHFIDFEQLKIENQSFNEKIEERNEELARLANKIRTTVQILSHLKEKQEFLELANLEKQEKLKTVESALAKKRDRLSRTKVILNGNLLRYTLVPLFMLYICRLYEIKCVKRTYLSLASLD